MDNTNVYDPTLMGKFHTEFISQAICGIDTLNDALFWAIECTKHGSDSQTTFSLEEKERFFSDMIGCAIVEFEDLTNSLKAMKVEVKNELTRYTS